MIFNPMRYTGLWEPEGPIPTRTWRGAWHPKLRMLWIENSSQLVLVEVSASVSQKINPRILKGHPDGAKKCNFC